ncbi:protein Flattop [Centroberyx affinis]|uniref:protein Flattop n=1 Tax=Centroberyx affinis TaxID=166261 RepID=UPI003A5BDB03
MASSYSANQYESAFKSQRLQNWCASKDYKERPAALEGHTTFIANDKGHLLPGVVKKGSAWPDFKGTWDLPARLPARCINPTGRSVEGRSRLQAWGLDPQHTSISPPHRGSKNTAGLPDAAQQVSGDSQQDGAAPSSRPPSRRTPSAAAARPASQNRPISGGERPASQNQVSQAAVDGSVAQPTAERPATQASGEDGPLTQCSQVGQQPASRPATGEGTSSRPVTGGGRPVSCVSEKAVTRHSSRQDGAASQGAPPSSRQRQREAQQDH